MLKVKVRGGGLMIWTRFAATGPERLVNIESTMSSSVYQSVLESNGPTAKAWPKVGQFLSCPNLQNLRIDTGAISPL